MPGTAPRAARPRCLAPQANSSDERTAEGRAVRFRKRSTPHAKRASPLTSFRRRWDEAESRHAALRRRDRGLRRARATRLRRGPRPKRLAPFSQHYSASFSRAGFGWFGSEAEVGGIRQPTGLRISPGIEKGPQRPRGLGLESRRPSQNQSITDGPKKGPNRGIFARS